MKKSLILIGIGLIFTLSACSGNVSYYDPSFPPERPASIEYKNPDTIDNFSYYLDPDLPQEVQDVVVENRRQLFVNVNQDFQNNPSKYINLNYDESVDKGIVETLKRSSSSMVKNDRLEFEIVEKELDFLMDYLKYAYGAYEFYGGDTVFYPMKKAIIAELRNKNEVDVSYDDYVSTLYEYLSASVVDCHFFIDDKSFNDVQRQYYFLLSEKHIFDKIDSRFYTEIGGLIYELISVDGEVPALLPYLNKSGQMVWVVGKSSTSSSSQTSTIVLLDESENRFVEKSVTLKAAYWDVKFNNFMYYEYERNDVKIVESRRCSVTIEKEDMFEKMNTSGKNLQGEKVVVVDLRNNSGGNSAYPKAWLEGYLDHKIVTDRGAFTSRRTQTTYYTSSCDDAYNDVLGTYEEFMGSGSYFYWQEPVFNPATVKANKGTLFIVLANANTGSAGEDYVDFLRQTENTIVVGTNTGGAYMTGNVTGINLPYTQTLLRCGYNLHLEPDLSSIEGKGIQPDIWAPPWDSLERVLKFIEINGLTEKDN